jgi:hypothetical protein
MAKPRLTEQQKRVRNTYEAHRDAPKFTGRLRLIEAIPPPSDLDAATRR